MSKSFKKSSSVLLAVTTLVWLSGATLLVPTAFAQSIEDLLKQIAALQTQLTSLQSGGGSSGVASVASGACSFSRDLTVGAKGDDVKCLQAYLKGTGHYTYSGGATGYYGSVTKSAVAAWQSANGLSPAVGYFGSKSRAKYASAAGAGGGNSVVSGVVVPASGLAVSLAADSPMGSAIAGAGQIDVGKWVLTASAGDGVNVTDLKLTRTGVVSDSNVSNLYLADETGVIFAQYSSLSSGVAQFNGLNLQVNAGQSRVIVLRMDLSTGASAGNTLGWRLDEVKSGATVVASPKSASKDLTVTTVSNPSLAAVTYTYVSSGTTIDAGTNGFLAHSATVNVTNSASRLKSLKYTVVGSATKGDLKNWKLKINGVEAATVASVGTNDTVTFVPTTEIKLPTGNSTLEVYVDVMGSPNRTMAINVLRPYDGVFEDSQYNTKVTPSTSGSATSVTINQGRVTVARATDTPTGNVPAGASNVTLSKFSFYAGGEPVKVRFLPITLTRSGSSSAAVNLDVRNVSVMDDVGNSVGTTISSPSGNWSSSVATLDFGTSSSYINYVIPANTTRVLSVKVDVQSATNSTSLRADLATPGSANLEGQISFQTSTGGTATGNTLTVVTSPLTVTSNGAFSSPTYVAGAQNVRIASFVLAASSAEGIKTSTLTFDKDSNANFDAQSLKVMIGSTQFGTTQAIVADAETAMTFSGSSPLLIPAGGSVVVDVFANILTSTTVTTHSAVIDLNSGTANGSVSNSAITWPAAISGQNVIIASGPTLTLAVDSDNVPASQRIMGSTDNVLFKVRLTANNTEDVRVTDIVFRDTITSGSGTITSYNNLKLYDGNTLLAGPRSMNVEVLTTGSVSFALGADSPLIVPKNTSKTVTLKGDVASFSSGGAVTNSSHIFSLNSVFGAADVTSYGKDSSSAATATTQVAGTAQSVYRTKPTLTSSLLGAASSRTRQGVDELANLNWSANAADTLRINTVTLKFVGGAVTSGTTAFTVNLIDATSNAAWGSSGAVTCTPQGGNSCAVSFAPAAEVTAGTTKVVKVRANSSSFNDTANSVDALSVIVENAGDVLWRDGPGTCTAGSDCTNGISWEAYQIPISVVNVSYP